MSQTILATFQNGVFTPAESLSLPDKAQVRLTVELLDEDTCRKQQQAALKALEELWRLGKIHSHEDRLTRDQLHERR